MEINRLTIIMNNEFDPASRATPGANDGSINQIKYCSEKCARKAENARHYRAHKASITSRVLSYQRAKKTKRGHE